MNEPTTAEIYKDLFTQWGGSVDTVSKARASFPDFVSATVRDKRGEGLVDSPLSRLFMDNAVHCHKMKRHLSIVAPPGVGKTTIDRAYLSYQIGLNPWVNIVVASAVKPVAEDQVGQVRNLIVSDLKQVEDYASYRQIFPEIIPDDRRSTVAKAGGQRGWRSDKFWVLTDGQAPDATMEAVAVETVAESRRVDILFAPDIMTRVIARSPAQRASLIEAFLQTWIGGRLSNGGWALVEQNCWNKRDLGHLLREDSRFCSVWVGVNRDCNSLFIRVWNPPDGLPIVDDPSMYGAEPTQPSDGAHYEFMMPLPTQLGENKIGNHEALVAHQTEYPSEHRLIYELKAFDDSDMMFPHWDSKTVLPGTLPDYLGLRDDMQWTVPENQQFRFAFAGGIDIAGDKRPGDSITIVGKDSTNKWFIAYHETGSFSHQQMVEKLDAIWNRGIRFGVVHVENNAVQSKIVDAIRADAERRQLSWVGRIVPFQTGKNKADPSIGLPSLDVEFETGRFVWFDGDAIGHTRSARELNFLSNDIMDCPRILKPGETSDRIMSLWFARRGLDRVSINPGTMAPRHITKTRNSSSGVSF